MQDTKLLFLLLLRYNRENLGVQIIKWGSTLGIELQDRIESICRMVVLIINKMDDSGSVDEGGGRHANQLIDCVW
jgi:hypothetical protein